jgi:hypothetical protein
LPENPVLLEWFCSQRCVCSWWWESEESWYLVFS